MKGSLWPQQLLGLLLATAGDRAPGWGLLKPLPNEGDKMSLAACGEARCSPIVLIIKESSVEIVKGGLLMRGMHLPQEKACSNTFKWRLGTSKRSLPGFFY